MTTYTAGDLCPKCGSLVKDIWGPANEQVRNSKVVHRVVNTLRCDRCGWHRVEEVVNTDVALNELLQSLKFLP